MKKSLSGVTVFFSLNLVSPVICKVKSWLPVDDLARPTPNFLLAAHTTWVKCPEHRERI
jgi:hypothetical protein